MKQVLVMVQQMHGYPFWVLIGFLYFGILLFGLCGTVMWFPALIPDVYLRLHVGKTLFDLGSAMVGVGGLTAPVMDLILHYDTNL